MGSFKGLEVADSQFERRTSNCSEEVCNSCGARDCLLNVFQLGEDTVLVGGLCPKGNTAGKTDKAPNYVTAYKNILNRKLGEITVPLNEQSGEKVLIPRSLTFLNETGVFQTALYHHLGFDVSVSPESDDEIADLGRKHAHPESCFPVILAHGHAAHLARHLNGKDKILLANSIGSFEPPNNRMKFCPYVAGIGHLIRGSLGLDENTTLLPDLKYNDPAYPMDESIGKDLRRVFGKRFKKRQIKEAVGRANEMQQGFLEDVRQKGERILETLISNEEDIFLGVGRGYTLLDPKASSRVDELFANSGLHFMPMFFLEPDKTDLTDIARNMYWLQGTSMIRANLKAVQQPGMYVVRATNFNCGPDSLILMHEQQLAEKTNNPRLQLETDGHNSNAQFGTRISAFNEVIKQRKSEIKIPLEQIKSRLPKLNGLKDRKLGIPYMGPSSSVVAATLRSADFDAEVMPTRTELSQEFAETYVTTNTCKPFAFQVGDHLAWLTNLRESQDPNETAAVLLPRAKGPCRFGQYSVILRNILDREGFDKVPIFDPGSEADYQVDTLDDNALKQRAATVYKGVFSSDVLHSALLRTRPYETTPGRAEEVYGEAQQGLISLIETNPSLKQVKKFLEQKAQDFAGIERIDERFPRVLMMGEIFVRCHEAANQDSVKMLEQHGLEVILDPTSAWFDYVNENSVKRFKNEGQWKNFATSAIKRVYMKAVAKTLYKPFSEILAGREFHNPFSHIRQLERDVIFTPELEGESPVSIGTVYAFINGELDVDGIYHVGPLGCMQETVATSRTQPLLRDARGNAYDKEIFPVMDAVFGESEQPNLDSQIALFAENCRIRSTYKSDPGGIPEVNS
ncbi:hypothetical protein COU62_01775 [Candidatus Pacearchaeota archaeon CG10_big_fil_rev_8_21_14_0_10_35_219]|nr:hypothetical protein [Candidatus Pacearchaeota archaeon]OIO42560.1 MAG: hypothetical protein AUJ63_02655 [Candidatus Pacearchaeota archaeon CG1_02_35_32]PIO07921.1 MAG: hypothetical protein COU62_01775 [Candidatus Pacearchaeota archaeon CG10_big_fil_rev_8_21_14_0_10_35_219]PIY81443.1 MAG: hypothetical protein COY79_02665 [Candidatus Pacearchaeota archaeon CG_4_10_14_0_8_um_filter_35_169]PIZ80655.1 MAG: hypothetical protein COY00_00830 [Candidatus Pacearchaeota archaeon CG_4_10_14_0_2_um_filt